MSRVAVQQHRLAFRQAAAKLVICARGTIRSPELAPNRARGMSGQYDTGLHRLVSLPQVGITICWKDARTELPSAVSDGIVMKSVGPACEFTHAI
ncbi:MAG TPA: hypothetical protein VG410_00890 [Solirubrobacteraceae bacterium]|nr:hypothetical protein [Solirubrobacteraceae bacterium]